MIGEHAFCPTSGASLSREIHYDEHGRPERAPRSEDLTPKDALEAPLTTGERRSSKRALSTYFQRCHRRHVGSARNEPEDGGERSIDENDVEAEDDDESDLYRHAALALTRLKRTATGRQERDVIVWYALRERLARDGFDVAWMTAHVEPRCPDCGSQLVYVTGPDRPLGRCPTSCTGDRRDRLRTIRTTVVALFERTYPETTLETDALTLL
ncbi:hypothetical protein OB955_17240 [Halobacteria archaeon AArc-m2/3/4]|uniref:Uncharacterized protein n=1 Tax=Natronoglomus mannanivorans TaxID=2979990 RepID=A0AAP2YZ26_9EURY|nr:hypothetical protein [Halobacteria archaeon AArc-xg1-1]MCU4974468.1 hypothetical protein [Halobacteria archaeon AArc-m2/3/4]